MAADILHEAELILMAVRVKELEVRLCAICDNWNPGDFDYFEQTLALYEKTYDQAVALGWLPTKPQLPEAKYPCYKVDSLCRLAENGPPLAYSYEPDTCPWRVRAESWGKVSWQRYSRRVCEKCG